MSEQNLETPVSVGEAAVGALGSSSTPTIVSGISRLQAVVSGAGSVIGELEALVGGMTGDGRTSAAKNVPGLAGAGTAGDIHTAATALEGFFGLMSTLVKRAKAAHG